MGILTTNFISLTKHIKLGNAVLNLNFPKYLLTIFNMPPTGRRSLCGVIWFSAKMPHSSPGCTQIHHSQRDVSVRLRNSETFVVAGSVKCVALSERFRIKIPRVLIRSDVSTENNSLYQSLVSLQPHIKWSTCQNVWSNIQGVQ